MPIMLTPRSEGTLLCKCGKLRKPDPDVMNRIKEAFEILKAQYYRTSPIATRGSKCDPNLWQQHHHKARDALRSATQGERAFTSIWDRWQNYETNRQCQLVFTWSDAWDRYLNHFSVHHNATQPQRERYMNLLHLRSVDENKQAPPLWQRPGYWKANKELSNPQMSKGEEQVLCFPISERKRLHNRSDLSLLEYLEWLSTKWGITICRRTSTAIILFQLVTKPNMVEFVFTDSVLAKMAPAQLAGRQMVRTMVNETTSNSRFSKKSNWHPGNWCEPTQDNKLNVATINQKV